MRRFWQLLFQFVFGLWSLVFGLWSLVFGLWLLAIGYWHLVLGHSRHFKYGFLLVAAPPAPNFVGVSRQTPLECARLDAALDYPQNVSNLPEQVDVSE